MRFCSYCGHPLDPITQECPICGGYKTQDLSDKFVAALKSKLRSPLMLILCILSTASVLFTMIDEEEFLSAILNLLIPIGLWITYFNACSSTQSMGLAGVKMVSVVITIIRVFLWILVGVFIVVAILFFAVPTVFNDIVMNFSFMMVEYSYMVDTLYELGSGLTFIIAAILCLAAIVITLINIFFYGSIGKSVKSVIESFNHSENRLNKLTAVKIWLMLLGIFACIGTLSDISLVGVLDTATLFAGALLAGKVGNTSSEDII